MVSEDRFYGGTTMGMGYPSDERLITARAIVTSIYDVIGVTVKDFSITPKKILAGPKEREKY
jgi:hypothetical protein